MKIPPVVSQDKHKIGSCPSHSEIGPFYKTEVENRFAVDLCRAKVSRNLHVHIYDYIAASVINREAVSRVREINR